MEMSESSRGPRRAVKPLLTFLLVASLVSGFFPVAAAWPPWTGEGERGPGASVTAEWLLEHHDDHDVVVVDVRPAPEYEKGHVPGARPADLYAIDLASAPGALSRAGIGGNEHVVFYDIGLLPDRAARAFWLAEAAGVERASVLDGGVDAWVQAGGALSTEPVEAAAAAWVTGSRGDRAATLAYVALSFGVDGREIIDARGESAWRGIEGRPRTGHVPQSLPLSPRAFLPDGKLLSPAESREMFSRFGPRPSSPIDLDWEFIVVGEEHSGAGSLLYYLLRRVGIERVRLCETGWTEWSADPALPVVRIITPEELKQRLERDRRWFAPSAPPPGFALFDVRHWADYQKGHIPGAVNLTSRLFQDSLDVYLDRHWPGLDRETAPIVTYCYGPDCIRSRLTSTVAARKGFRVVERLYDGLQGWRSIGGGIVESPQTGE
jgi:thiosulfate/3-mercaptopyruvate sulfurtransferase